MGRRDSSGKRSDTSGPAGAGGADPPSRSESRQKKDKSSRSSVDEGRVNKRSSRNSQNPDALAATGNRATLNSTGSIPLQSNSIGSCYSTGLMASFNMPMGSRPGRLASQGMSAIEALEMVEDGPTSGSGAFGKGDGDVSIAASGSTRKSFAARKRFAASMSMPNFLKKRGTTVSASQKLGPLNSKSAISSSGSFMDHSATSRAGGDRRDGATKLRLLDEGLRLFYNPPSTERAQLLSGASKFNMYALAFSRIAYVLDLLLDCLNLVQAEIVEVFAGSGESGSSIGVDDALDDPFLYWTPFVLGLLPLVVSWMVLVRTELRLQSPGYNLDLLRKQASSVVAAAGDVPNVSGSAEGGPETSMSVRRVTSTLGGRGSKGAVPSPDDASSVLAIALPGRERVSLRGGAPVLARNSSISTGRGGRRPSQLGLVGVAPTAPAMPLPFSCRRLARRQTPTNGFRRRERQRPGLCRSRYGLVS